MVLTTKAEQPSDKTQKKHKIHVQEHNQSGCNQNIKRCSKT